ncbi:MAG: hypothetical protein A2Y38_12085 [Spirochaetes bacterium GWB1_59_5]|nr:MAG: hypothetical protein A2Y38_12085 [Spirochaetes bacterium GWB1_59_5]
MSRMVFNPASFVINMAIGWFVMSFLQAAARAIIAGNREGLLVRFKSIAFFHDRPAAVLNVAIIAIIWIVTTGIWFAVRRK